MPERRYGTRTHAGVIRAVAALASLGFLAGCADVGAEGGGTGSGGTENRYVEGDGSATTFPPADREEAPDVSGETIDGEPISLADYEGEVVAINFWASWCAPCRAETPVLEEVYDENRDAGLEFLGINIKDDRQSAAAFERNQEISYPSLYDQPGKVSQAFRDTVPPQAIPSTLIIDREGRIAARVIGATDYSTLSELVEPIVAKDEEAGPR